MKLIQMNSNSEELNKTRPEKPLTYVNPGCYKRRITTLLQSTLQDMELNTLIQDSIKRELMDTFKSKRSQIIKDLLEFTLHIHKICVFDQNYRRNKMRRVKRRKLSKLKLPIRNVQNKNECLPPNSTRENKNEIDSNV